MLQQCERVRTIPPVKRSNVGSMVFGYVSRTDNMEVFDDRIRRFEEEGKIPNLDMEAQYTIYRWKVGFIGHESVVLGFQGKFFTVEIRVLNKTLTLFTTADNINERKLVECGQKVSTGKNLIAIASDVYRNTKSFSLSGSNCQNFVNNFLEAIEMVDQVKETDADWLFKWGSIAAIGAAALVGFAAMRKERRQ